MGSLTNSQKRQREQCFLASYIDIFARRNGVPNAANLSNTQSTTDSESVDNWSSRAFQDIDESERPEVSLGPMTYSTFTKLLSVNPGILINRLVTSPNAQDLFNLTPEKMSAIIPKLRLYKMYYENEEDVVGTASEFLFDTNYNMSDLESILVDGQGRGAGVGIKNFSWELVGTNTAEIDNNIRASLKIFFQNFSDFVNSRVLQEIMDADTEAERTNAVTERRESPDYLDLIFRTSRYGSLNRAEGRRSLDERYYRIKAILGWTVDQAMVEADIITPDEKRLIENVGTILLLSLLKHDIDFREDGTVELTLEYQASVESTISNDKTNVLYIPATLPGAELSGDPAEVVAELDDQLAQARQTEQDLNNAESGSENSPARSDGCADANPLGDLNQGDLEDAREGNAERIAQLEQQRRSIFYRIYIRLLETIIDKSRIYTLQVPDELFEDDSLDWNQINNEVMVNGSATRSGQAGNAEESAEIASVADRLRQILLDEAGESAETAATEAGNEAGVAEDTDWLSAGDDYRFHYMYLGDILDAALMCLDSEQNPLATPEMKNVKVLLGTLYVPLPNFRSPDGSVKDVLVNMADIPVSLHLFQHFFLERTVRIGRTVWPLGDFIKEMLTLMIYPALGSECAERRRGRRPPRAQVNVNLISAYASQDGRDRVLDARVEDIETPAPEGNEVRERSSGGSIVLDDQVESVLPSGDRPHAMQDLEIINYLIVQATDFSTFGRNALAPGAAEEDAAEGIYWLNIGSDRGLVKSIKFKKTDQPGLGEARQEREGTLGLGQIKDKYDADVTLFGNALFQPGQIIYIHPTVRGIGSGISRHLSSILGIGGYHQIITVDNNISENNYETVLNTKWVASGVPGDENVCLEEPATAEPESTTQNDELRAIAAGSGQFSEEEVAVLNTLEGDEAILAPDALGRESEVLEGINRRAGVTRTTQEAFIPTPTTGTPGTGRTPVQ